MLVKDLLDAPALGIRLLSGDSKSLSRTLRWTYTTDLPDPSRYIAGGELVITGLMWRRCAEDSGAFVKAVSEAGASALAAGEGLLGHIPIDVIEACEQFGLPLLAVPDSVSFGQLTEHLIDTVTGDRFASLNATLMRQRQLLTAVADGRALDELALSTARESGRQCWIFTATGRQLVAGQAGLTDNDVDRITKVALSAERLPATVMTTGGLCLTIFGVGAALVHRATRWYLAVAGDVSDFAPEMVDAFGQLAAIAALDRVRREEGRSVRREIADQAIRLVEADTGSPETTVRLRQAGLQPDLPMVALSASFTDDSELRGVLRLVLADTLASFPGSCVGVDSRGDIVGLVNVVTRGPEGETDPPADDVVTILRRRLTRLTPVVGRGRLLVGVSAVVDAPALEGAIRSARHALSMGRNGDRPVVVSAGAELNTAAALLSVIPDSLRRTFAADVLGPLQRYDQKTDSGLMETLTVFLEQAGSWNRTADELHVHLNTVRYRIGKIEDLLDRDLGTTRDRVDVYLALQSL